MEWIHCHFHQFHIFLIALIESFSFYIRYGYHSYKYPQMFFIIFSYFKLLKAGTQCKIKCINYTFFIKKVTITSFFSTNFKSVSQSISFLNKSLLFSRKTKLVQNVSSSNVISFDDDDGTIKRGHNEMCALNGCTFTSLLVDHKILKSKCKNRSGVRVLGWKSKSFFIAMSIWIILYKYVLLYFMKLERHVR